MRKGHGLVQRSDIPCISDVIDAYLFDLHLPPAGYTCPAVSLAPRQQHDIWALDTAKDDPWGVEPLEDLQ